MIYCIWDTESANLLADRATIEDALRAIRRVVQFSGLAALSTLALEREDDQGTVTVLAEGEQLARVAEDGIPA